MNSLAPVRFVGDWLLGIARVVSEQPGESEQIHLRNITAVISAIVVATAAIIWVMIYFVAGEDLAGLVPTLHTSLTAFNIGVYKFSGRYRAFEFSQLTLNLILPLLLTLTLGGFLSSSAVVIWALVTPMAAIVYSSRRMSMFWVVASLGAVIFGALIDSSLDHANSVPAWARMTLFAGNILVPSSIAFFLLAYLVKENDIAYALVSFE